MTRSTSPFRSRPPRPAFTLVELLVVIIIITILASIAMFALYGVREDARERRARAQIAKLHELIMERWEGYRTRPIPVAVPPGTDPRAAAALRLNALRELMRMELPDRITDLCFYNTSTSQWEWNGTPPAWLAAPPSAWLAFQRRFNANLASGRHWTSQHEHAECLYMILAGIRDGDTTGLEWFDPSEVGDTDNDGMLEILDPWGKPIYFLRWAPGYESDLQDPRRREPDPFDPLRVDPRWANNDDANPNTRLDDPFALYPLIYSAGRDHEYGVVRKDYDNATPPNDLDVAYGETNTAPYATATLNPALYPYAAAFPAPPWPSLLWPSRPMNDPYMILPMSGDYIGRKFVTNNHADDDITNHTLEVR